MEVNAILEQTDTSALEPSALNDAVDVLAALGHGARLRVFRLLIQAGPPGLAAGVIAQTLAMPASTLSFHLAHLAKVGVVSASQQGRQVIYRAAFHRVRWLTNFLFENCCGGAACDPVADCTQTHCGDST